MRHERGRPFPSIADQVLVVGLSMPDAALDQRAGAMLEDVVSARSPRDLDMAIHRLRDMLFWVLTEGCSPPQLTALLPVLTRMAALDRAFDCHLCLGLQHLMDRAAHLKGRDRADQMALRGQVLSWPIRMRGPIGHLPSVPAAGLEIALSGCKKTS